MYFCRYLADTDITDIQSSRYQCRYRYGRYRYPDCRYRYIGIGIGHIYRLTDISVQPYTTGININFCSSSCFKNETWIFCIYLIWKIKIKCFYWFANILFKCSNCWNIVSALPLEDISSCSKYIQCYIINCFFLWRLRQSFSMASAQIIQLLGNIFSIDSKTLESNRQTL